MTTLAVFTAEHCNAESFVRELQVVTDCRVIDDRRVVAKATQVSGMTEKEIRRCFSCKPSMFNGFNHEKEFSIASLQMALADEIIKGPAIVQGLTALLLPKNMLDSVRVCLTADRDHRVDVGKGRTGLPSDTIQSTLEASDRTLGAWTNHLFSISDPWSPILYDIVIKTDRHHAAEAAVRITNRLHRKRTEMDSNGCVDKKDFRLAATVGMALGKAGHNASVRAKKGVVSLLLNKQVLMRSRLESELISIAERIPGVQTVKTQIEGDERRETIFRKRSDESPPRVLLVDDEEEFVRTLSERLQLRGIGTAVAFDGLTALDLVREDEPEVMIVDLRMPGIDGMELLSRVKSTRPQIEVIILTGHGNESDREQSMEQGAFAYMQKPVNIDQLNFFLKNALEKKR